MYHTYANYQKLTLYILSACIFVLLEGDVQIWQSRDPHN